MRIGWLALLAAALGSAPATAQPSAVASAVRATVDREAPRSIALLERLVNQNSGTLNLPGVRAVGELVRPELEQLGFRVRWVDQSATGRAGHLVATHAGGRRANRILIIGHLDTVFEPSSPFQRFARDGDEATGPGINDDKGGIVVTIAALRALQAAGRLRAMNVTIYLTGDEERPGTPLAAARADLIAAGRQADFALEVEPLVTEDDRDYGTTARRSAASWTLTTRGRTGHSSVIFGENSGYGAIYEMARILDAFRRELRETGLTYNVGVVGGGTPAAIDAQGLAVTASGKTNVIPETAVARGDIRALTRAQEAQARERMRAIVAQHLPRTEGEIVFDEDGYPPMEATDANRRLLDTLNQVNRDLGLPEMPPFDPIRRGAADSSFVSGNVATIGGMGLSGWGSHAVGEGVDLTSLHRQALRLAMLMVRLSDAPQPARRAVSR